MSGRCHLIALPARPPAQASERGDGTSSGREACNLSLSLLSFCPTSDGSQMDDGDDCVKVAKAYNLSLSMLSFCPTSDGSQMDDGDDCVNCPSRRPPASPFARPTRRCVRGSVDKWLLVFQKSFGVLVPEGQAGSCVRFFDLSVRSPRPLSLGSLFLSCVGEITLAIWLILPVVIRLSQRLSHACLSISALYCETANGSLYQS